MDIKAINNSAHGQLKIKNNENLQQSKNKHFAPVVVQEFIAASQEFPIVFIKDSGTGQFKAIALLGLKTEENLFFRDDAWQAAYKPEGLTLYPFLLHQEKNRDNAVLCFDEDSFLVNKTEGEALFDKNGVQNQWLTDKGERIVSYIEKTNTTENFIKLLLDKKLLSPQTLNLKLEGEDEYSINGLYVIDEKKLAALSEQSFSELRKVLALPAIYAAIFSLQRINHLVRIKLAD
ncbi:MAG: SapC family protein [Colwellia sp.]|nr:SapC family protein [Colwellia sp.]